MNHLSEAVNKKYNVIYSQLESNDVTIYKSKNGNWGAIKDENNQIIPARHDFLTYYADKNWFTGVVKKDFLTRKRINLVYDGNGKLLRKFKGKYLWITPDEFGNIRCSIELEAVLTNIYGEKYSGTITKYGILNNELDEILPPKYEALHGISVNLFKVNISGKWGLVDEKDQCVLPLEFTRFFDSIDHGTNLILAQKESNFYQIDKTGKIVKQLPFSHIPLIHSNCYWFKRNINLLQKVIVNGAMRSDDSEDYWLLDDMVEYEGKWGIANQIGEIIIEPNYDYIDFFGLTKCFKIFKGEMQFNIDDEGTQYMTGSKCGIINPDGKEIVPCIYEWIEEVAPNLWMVCVGSEVIYNAEYQEEYWERKGGKIGLINTKGDIVVPIEYDSIYTCWYRVNDLIFLQKGTFLFDENKSYDVFNHDGVLQSGVVFDFRTHAFTN